MPHRLGLPVADIRDQAGVYEVDQSEVPDDLVVASDDDAMVADRARITLDQAPGKPHPPLDEMLHVLKGISHRGA